jgi:DNA topoisomerase-3
MARAGLARLSDAVFEKDGKQVPYRTVRLTPAGRAADTTTPVGFIMKDTATLADRQRARKTRPAAPKRRTGAAVKQLEPQKRKRTPPATDSRVEEALRSWRLREARRRGVPAFRIFTDQAMRALAQARPQTAAELLSVPGIGISTVEKYGREIYGICRISDDRQS